MKTLLFIVPIVLIGAVAGAALAQEAAPAQVPSSTPAQGWGPRFVDADGDGLCDNLGQGRGAGRGRGRGWHGGR